MESMNFSTCVYMQIVNFRDGHVTTFRHPGAYICQVPGHRLQTSKRQTFWVDLAREKNPDFSQ